MPGDAQVQAIVGLARRGIGEVVAWSRLEPHVPVFGRGDLRRIRLLPADEPPEQLTRLRGDAYPEQEMPYHRHPVTAENEALNITKIQCAPRTWSGIRPGGLVPAS